jgi:hypothetical protein
MKKSVFLGLATMIAFCALIYWLWQRSPGRAIDEVRMALQTKDLALLYSRIDLHALRSSAIDALSTHELSASAEAPGFVEKLGSQVKSGTDKITSSKSLDLLKREIELELRRDRSKPEPLDERLEKHSLRLLLHDIKTIDFHNWTEADGDVLLNMTIHLLKMNTSYPLTSRFRKSDEGVWRLSGFEGLASLLARYEADRLTRVKAHNAGLQGRLEQSLPFFGETRLESADAGLSSTLFLDILFHNKSQKDVSRIEGLITDSFDTHRIQEAFLNHDAVIRRLEKKVFLLSKPQFLSPADPQIQGLRLKFQYSMVEYSDGEILKIAKDFDEITP